MTMGPSSREGRPLFGIVSFLVVGVGLVGLAVALHPQLLGPEPLRDRDVDFVSLSYLAVEVARHPADRALRARYARQLAAVGRFEDAARVATPLLHTDATDEMTLDLLTGIELGRLRAATGPARLERTRRMLERLDRTVDLPLSSGVRTRFAAIARELGDRVLEARMLERLDDGDLASRLERSARLLAEAGYVDEAADRWRRIAELELENTDEATPKPK